MSNGGRPKRPKPIDVVTGLMIAVVTGLGAFASAEASSYADISQTAQSMGEQARAEGNVVFLRRVLWVASDAEIWTTLRRMQIEAQHGIGDSPEIAAAVRSELLKGSSEYLENWMSENSLEDADADAYPFTDDSYYRPIDATWQGATSVAYALAEQSADAEANRNRLAGTALAYALALSLFAFSAIMRAGRMRVLLLVLGGAVGVVGAVLQALVPVVPFW